MDGKHVLAALTADMAESFIRAVLVADFGGGFVWRVDGFATVRTRHSFKYLQVVVYHTMPLSRVELGFAAALALLATYAAIIAPLTRLYYGLETRTYHRRGHQYREVTDDKPLPITRRWGDLILCAWAGVALLAAGYGLIYGLGWLVEILLA